MNSSFETWSSSSQEVQAIQLTELNLRHVAEFCGGKVSNTRDHRGKKFLIFTTFHFNREHTAKAFIGDWVVCKNLRFQYFRDETFRRRHMRKDERYQKLLEMVGYESVADRIFGLFATGDSYE